MPTIPCAGLIVPPERGVVPTDGRRIYGETIDFVALGLGLADMSVSGYDSVVDLIEARSRELARRGADAISLMGTSVSFFRGPDFNDEIVSVMENAAQLPATTMSNGVLSALQMLGAHRVVVATAYVDDINARLRAFLEADGVEVLGIQGLGIGPVEDLERIGEDEVELFATHLWEVAGDSADGLLISCGGLPTLEAVPRLERRLGVPVVSSSMAGFWDVARLCGIRNAPRPLSRLFGRAPSKPDLQWEEEEGAPGPDALT